jgi:hypothetical protein
MWNAAGLKGLDGAVTRGELPQAEHRAGHVARAAAGHYREAPEQQHPGSDAQRDRKPVASNPRGEATDGAEPTRSASNSSGAQTTGTGGSTLVQPSRSNPREGSAGARQDCLR